MCEQSEKTKRPTELIIRDLWSSGKTDELIENLAKDDSDKVTYNLLEDIRVLKEELGELNSKRTKPS